MLRGDSMTLNRLLFTDGTLYRQPYGETSNGDIAVFDGISLVGYSGAFSVEEGALTWEKYDVTVDTGTGASIRQRADDPESHYNLEVVAEGLSATLYHDAYRGATYMPCNHYDPLCWPERAFYVEETTEGDLQLVVHEGEARKDTGSGIADLPRDDLNSGEVVLRTIGNSYARRVSREELEAWEPVETVGRIDPMQDADEVA